MKTTRTAIGKLYDAMGAIREKIKELEAISARTPKIESALKKNKEEIMYLNHAVNSLRLKTIFTPLLKKKNIAEKYSNNQRQKREKRQIWHGLTVNERSERNQKIIEHYKKASQNGHISLHGFAEKYREKDRLGITQIKNIITSSLDA